jgi:fatty-acyl-CoA synthase
LVREDFLMKTVQKTVGELLTDVSRAYPRNDALIHTESNTRFTHQLLQCEVERVARGLLHVGVSKGDRVALWAPNIPEWIVAQIALARIGAVMVPIDPGAEREDLHFILEQSEARVTVLTRGLEAEEYIHLIQSERYRLPRLEHVIVVSDTSFPDTILWTELMAMGDDLPAGQLEEREGQVGPEDPLAIMYTSGTTGRPKGVVLDHLALINKSMASTDRQGIGPRDRLCLFFPLFHMFGNTCIALAGLLRGAALVMPCRTFDPERVLRALDREACTAVYGSPSMLIALLDHPRFNAKKWRSVTKGTLGGAPCPMELMKRIYSEVGVSDITVAYGITETASWITMTHPDDPLELRTGTIGTPLPVNEVRITDPETDDDLPPGKEGELCIRGFLMKEYYRMPAATAAAVDRNGWFHSGDLGQMDRRGYVKITGRLKDVIVRDGIRIHPTELEEILYSIPEISEAQVFGFPHPEQGQEIAAWFRVRGKKALPPDRVRKLVESRVGRERAPRYYKQVEAFPMTRTGKVQKFKMARMAEKEYLGGDTGGPSGPAGP